MSSVEALATARTAGGRAYARGDVRAPAVDPYLLDLIRPFPVVGSGAADVMRAWLDGWDAALAASTPPVLIAPHAQPLSLFAAPDPLGTLDLFTED